MVVFPAPASRIGSFAPARLRRVFQAILSGPRRSPYEPLVRLPLRPRRKSRSFVVFAVSAVSWSPRLSRPRLRLLRKPARRVSAAAPTAPDESPARSARQARQSRDAGRLRRDARRVCRLAPAIRRAVAARAKPLVHRPKALAGPEQRSSFLIKAGDLALLLGLFDEAAASYAEAATQAPEAARAGISAASAALLVRACPCDLAAGDTEKALGYFVQAHARHRGSRYRMASRLVGAGARAARSPGRGRRARHFAHSEHFHSRARREARFILWGLRVRRRKYKAAATLAAEFPGSPEALIASGSAATPPLPGTGISAACQRPPCRHHPRLQRPKRPLLHLPRPNGPRDLNGCDPIGLNSSGRHAGERLQIGGLFPSEKTRALSGTEPRVQGFRRPTDRGNARFRLHRRRTALDRHGTRCKGSCHKRMQALKDAGYEAYIID